MTKDNPQDAENHGRQPGAQEAMDFANPSRQDGAAGGSDGSSSYSPSSPRLASSKKTLR